MSEGVISAKLIREPKRWRRCDQCGRRMWSHVRLYGNAFETDPKYVLRICSSCALASGDPKVKRAIVGRAPTQGELVS